MVMFAAIIAAVMVIAGALFAFVVAGGLWAAISALRPELLRDRDAGRCDP